jgi:probable FeS assembly SUF system protein SufT
MTQEQIPLKRDCDAVMVPSGAKVTLQAGHLVMITQALGGTYTVIINGNMARIDGKDADAIGKEVVVTPKEAVAHTGPVDQKALWDQMRTCYDPEIPVNIVDLGLVYDCKVTPVPENGNKVEVKMTLTAPGCGMGSSIAADVERKIRSVPGVTDASVELVWEPQWNQSMMSEAAKLQLGML